MRQILDFNENWRVCRCMRGYACLMRMFSMDSVDLCRLGGGVVGRDVLIEGNYETDGLSAANHDLDKLFLALQIAKSV